MVKWHISGLQLHNIHFRIVEKKKIQNLLNPQVALTDEYGNDFLFPPTSFTSEMLKSEEEKRKFVAKCETTDNRRMMNE
jgi:hypothetical protein